MRANSVAERKSIHGSGERRWNSWAAGVGRGLLRSGRTLRSRCQLRAHSWPAGAVIEGAAGVVREVTDVWTFARDTRSADPNWKLIATSAA